MGEVTADGFPYGTVFIDEDGEVLMSLGRIEYGSLFCFVLVRVPTRDDNLAHVPVDLIGSDGSIGTRYAVQEPPSA